MGWEPDLDGKRVDCRDCMDTGLIECWSPKAMAIARHYVRHGKPVAIARIPTHSVGTQCPCGSKRKSFGDEIPTYDRDKWLRLKHIATEDMAALITWAENYEPRPKYDFGEWNG